VYKAVIEEENPHEIIEDKEETPHKKKDIPHKRAIKRRYREFMELHSRLCNGPMTIYMKGRVHELCIINIGYLIRELSIDAIENLWNFTVGFAMAL
jgi:hypothetical protein